MEQLEGYLGIGGSLRSPNEKKEPKGKLKIRKQKKKRLESEGVIQWIFSRSSMRC